MKCFLESYPAQEAQQVEIETLLRVCRDSLTNNRTNPKGATIEAQEQVMNLRVAAIELQKENVKLREENKSCAKKRKSLTTSSLPKACIGFCSPSKWHCLIVL